MSEQQVIEQLQEYRRIVARIKVLERQPVGMGYTVSMINQDDKLQELHERLKGLPSYMYLTAREQELETTAHIHLHRYPAGIRSQHREISGLRDEDPEETERLKDLTKRIKTVLEARTGTADGYEEIMERMTELQELQVEKEYIDNALDVLEELRPGYGRLIRLRYIEGLTVEKAALELKIVRKTFTRWSQKAVEEYSGLMRLS